jgi:hypothetical protein
VLGDLEEEFLTRLGRSGHRTARGWYWHQALRTCAHLAWETVRAEPLSTTAQVLASLVVGSLLFREMNGWVVRFVSNLSIYDYETSLWSWRIGLYLALMHVLEVFLPATVFTWSLLVGGMMRRLQVTRGSVRSTG